MPPEDVITGVIDLLYRDPKTKELVVVDYKTRTFYDEHRWQLSVYTHLPFARKLSSILPRRA